MSRSCGMALTMSRPPIGTLSLQPSSHSSAAQVIQLVLKCCTRPLALHHSCDSPPHLSHPLTLLPPGDNIIDMLRKSKDFMSRSGGPQTRIIGRSLGLGNMWLSSCEILRTRFLAKTDSAEKCHIWHFSPNLALQYRNVIKLRTLCWQTIQTS